jgi:hypothetical protein
MPASDAVGIEVYDLPLDDELNPESVSFPDVPDIAAIWRSDGPERAWDAVIDFEFEVEVSFNEARRRWPIDVDEGEVIAAVYGEHFETPREKLAALIQADSQGRAELVSVWRQQRYNGADCYDERDYWQARGLVSRADEFGPDARLHRPARRRGTGGRPRVRAGAGSSGGSRGSPSDDDGEPHRPGVARHSCRALRPALAEAAP